MTEDSVVGHKTFIGEDGSRYHESLMQSEADQIFVRIEANEAMRRELMPAEEDAIKMIFEARERLKELGWEDARYCPKDGSEFYAIETGCSGKLVCHQRGEHCWTAAAGDLWPVRPVMFRLVEEKA